MTLGKGEMIQGRWKLIEKLGAGGFGEVYSAADVDSDEIVAVKIEKEGHRSGEGIRAGGLYYEQKVYGWLNATEPPVSGVVRKRWFGNERGSNALVMDCLGPPLLDRLKKCGSSLSLKSVLMIRIQTLRRLRFVHHRSFVHRDLKPGNLLTGMDKLSGTVYLADFGMASPYRDHYTKRHISYRTGKSFRGTAIFASINVNEGNEISRRDDLKSLVYVLIYLVRGTLPWKAVQLSEMAREKVNESSEDLFRGLPCELSSFYSFVRRLNFAEEPNYSRLRMLLQTAMQRNGFMDDGKFDWA